MIANVTNATHALSGNHRDIRNNPFRGVGGVSDILNIFNIGHPPLGGRSQNNSEADPSKTRALIDMGFPDERARRALLHFRNDIDLAMDYLIHTPAEHDHILNQSNQNSSSVSRRKYLNHVV
jgi:hypothetical protein